MMIVKEVLDVMISMHNFFHKAWKYRNKASGKADN
jgi:hypothetical protein